MKDIVAIGLVLLNDAWLVVWQYKFYRVYGIQIPFAPLWLVMAGEGVAILAVTNMLLP